MVPQVGRLVFQTAARQQWRMDTPDALGPGLALAFTCVAAVGSSMVRRFRIEDAKSCTRVCRRILSCTASSQPSDVTNNVCA